MGDSDKLQEIAEAVKNYDGVCDQIIRYGGSIDSVPVIPFYRLLTSLRLSLRSELEYTNAELRRLRERDHNMSEKELIEDG